MAKASYFFSYTSIEFYSFWAFGVSKCQKARQSEGLVLDSLDPISFIFMY